MKLKTLLKKINNTTLIGLGKKEKTYFILAYKDKVLKAFPDYLDKKINSISLEKVDIYNSYLNVVI